jgi:hypothetical protein
LKGTRIPALLDPLDGNVQAVCVQNHRGHPALPVRFEGAGIVGHRREKIRLTLGQQILLPAHTKDMSHDEMKRSMDEAKEKVGNTEMRKTA